MTKTPKIVLVDSNTTYDKYYLQFKGGSVGLGGIGKDSISREGKYTVDVPGLSPYREKRFKTKSQAIKALKMYVGKH